MRCTVPKPTSCSTRLVGRTPRRVFAVIRRDIVVDQLVDVTWRSDGGLHLRIGGHPQRDDHHDGENAAAVPAHQRQVRYATTGNDTVQNRTNVPLSGAWAPVTTERARATRLDSRPVSSESDPIVPADRSIDRWVETRW